jgi:segregation and condensation protein A
LSSHPPTAGEPEGEREAILRTPPGPPSTDLIADGVRTRASYAVSLDMFEGPLDLLLHLVRRHELDILDIPISFIAEKYIEYISFARALDIEIAGEYLVMAATLAFLKSRELLPPSPEDEDEDEDEEEGVDPREELIRRLIEYERFRHAGEELSARPLFGRDVFPRGGDLSVEAPEPGLAPVTLFKLAEAYNRILDRAKIAEDHEVVIEPVTVRKRMRQLSLLLRDRARVSFESLFLEQTWSSERELRAMLVVTLMSVLEMAKLGLIGVHQALGSETLELERIAAADEMERTVSAFHEEGEEDEEEEEDDAAEPSEQAAEPAEAAEPGEQAAEPGEQAAEPTEQAAEPGEQAAEPATAVEPAEAQEPPPEAEPASAEPGSDETE